MSAKIHGSEYPVRKIFSNDFIFSIPLYQRPYSWTTEQAGELLDDLLSFVGHDNSQPVDTQSPYFLGSIVLIKEEGTPNAEIVDGQQRLTTLTILLSVLRQTIATTAIARAFTDYLYQEGNPLEGTPNQYRLALRDRDSEFFRTYIQDSGKLDSLRGLNIGHLSDSQRNIRSNALLFVERLTALPEAQKVRLGQFIVKQCLLVVVSTPDLNSAYRIFSILNDRGLDLSHSDILKSEVIGRIANLDEQEVYNNKWEDAEELLGRDAFSDLFSHIRMIFRRAKAKETILKEFREYVIRPNTDSKAIIDNVLIPFADALATIRAMNYESVAGAEAVNTLLRWLNRIDNTDWLPSAIAYFAKCKSDANALRMFFCDLERLAAFMMICRFGINERFERYGRLLESIESGADLFEKSSPLQMSTSEGRQLLQELHGDVYRHTPKRRLYVLLRLDAQLSDGSASYDHGAISIEHVLPQNPPEDSKWCEWFPTQLLRERWVHRLGNLALLNHKKNSSAGNFEFDRKKTAYFVRKGISPFPLTTQVLTTDEWTLDVVKGYQRTRLDILRKLWHLPDLVDDIMRTDDEPESDYEGDLADASEAAASFHAAIVPRLEKHFGQPLIEGPNRTWAILDQPIVVSCQVSKLHDRKSRPFWFGLKRQAKERLASATKAFCAFGLGSPDNVLVIPYAIVSALLSRLRVSAEAGGEIRHWHIEFRQDGGRILLVMSGDREDVDVSEFLLARNADG